MSAKQRLNSSFPVALQGFARDWLSDFSDRTSEYTSRYPTWKAAAVLNIPQHDGEKSGIEPETSYRRNGFPFATQSYLKNLNALGDTRHAPPLTYLRFASSYLCLMSVSSLSMFSRLLMLRLLVSFRFCICWLSRLFSSTSLHEHNTDNCIVVFNNFYCGIVY